MKKITLVLIMITLLLACRTTKAYKECPSHDSHWGYKAAGAPEPRLPAGGPFGHK